MNYYEILNVDKNATIKEIEENYDILVKKYKSEVELCMGGNGVNIHRIADRIEKIKEAYEVLSNEDKRKQYDYLNSMLHNDEEFKDVNYDYVKRYMENNYRTVVVNNCLIAYCGKYDNNVYGYNDSGVLNIYCRCSREDVMNHYGVAVLIINKAKKDYTQTDVAVGEMCGSICHYRMNFAGLDATNRSADFHKYNKNTGYAGEYKDGLFTIGYNSVIIPVELIPYDKEFRKSHYYEQDIRFNKSNAKMYAISKTYKYGLQSDNYLYNQFNNLNNDAALISDDLNNDAALISDDLNNETEEKKLCKKIPFFKRYK